MDAVQILMQEEKLEAEQHEKEIFSFKWLAEKIIKRQNIGKDTIIIIIGGRRQGKSNWGLKLIRAFAKLKKESNPDYKWSWRGNFPITRGGAVRLADKAEEGTFIFYDEGADIAYKGDTNSFMSKQLIKFLNKSGKKRILTILCLPNIKHLDSNILNMANMIVAVPYRYEYKCSFAFIYGSPDIPFLHDKFGLEAMKRYFASKKSSIYRQATLTGNMRIRDKNEIITIPYPKSIFSMLRKIGGFTMFHHFKRVDQVFESRYIKQVKDKQLMAHMQEETYITKVVYNNLARRYATLIYNLKLKQNMSYAQIERLHIDPEGSITFGKEGIQRIINRMAAKYPVLIEAKVENAAA